MFHAMALQIVVSLTLISFIASFQTPELLTVNNSQIRRNFQKYGKCINQAKSKSKRNFCLVWDGSTVASRRNDQLKTDFGSFRLMMSSVDDAEESSESKKNMSKQRDLSSDGFGMLLPLAESIDNFTGGWGLSYADLSPETPRTLAGRVFLATNLGYAVAGLALGLKGDFLLGFLTEMAGVVSFWYHYSQLQYGTERSEVRLALLTDYITAGTALITGFIYIAQMGVHVLPLDTILIAAASVVSLGLCWVWEFGIPYLILHSLWHILSAYTALMIGQAHLASTGVISDQQNLFTLFT